MSSVTLKGECDEEKEEEDVDDIVTVLHTLLNWRRLGFAVRLALRFPFSKCRPRPKFLQNPKFVKPSYTI
jgi:hypothetical protein